MSIEDSITVPTAVEAAENESRKRPGEELDFDGQKRATTMESSKTTVGESNAARELVMKILCPNKMVGAIIGKGGTTLKQLKEASQTDIRISQDNDYFPETTDRIIGITGPPENVMYGITAVVSKMFEISDSDPSRSMILLPPASATDGSVPARRHLVRGLIPLGASGLIIGHAGAIIKEMSEMSGTKVQLAEGADPYGTKERIVNVFSPTCEAAVQAFQLVFSKLTGDPDVGTFSNTSVRYSNSPRPQMAPMGGYGMPYGMPMPHQAMYGGAAMPVGQYGGGRVPAPVVGATGGYAPYNPGVYSSSKSIGIPDTMVGAVVGRGGSIVKDIMAQTGTRINISQKGDLIPGTNNRKMTITGPQQGIECAEYMIMSQLSKASNQGHEQHQQTTTMYPSQSGTYPTQQYPGQY